MANPLNPDEAEDVSGKKENFIGKVIGCSMEGVVEGSGYKNPSQDYEQDVPSFDHFLHIKPLDGTYEKNQNVFQLSVRTGKTTKWMVMMSHLKDIHGEEFENEVKEIEDLPEFLTGRVYEFRDVTFTEDDQIPILGITYNQVGQQNDQINSMLVPIREVTDENELADLGVEDTADVDTSVEI